MPFTHGTLYGFGNAKCPKVSHSDTRTDKGIVRTIKSCTEPFSDAQEKAAVNSNNIETVIILICK